MSALLRITDGLGGADLLDLNATANGIRLGRDHELAAGQIGEDEERVSWSAQSGPAGLGPRQIRIPLKLIGSTADDLGTRVAALMEDTRSDWWLKVQRHNASNPSWLRCRPCVPQIETAIGGGSYAHVAQGTLTAETDPYAYGARVDQAATAVSANPTSASSWRLDVNGVGGDSLTPAVLRMLDATAHADQMGAWIGVRRRGTPSNLTAVNLTSQAAGSVTANGTNATWSDLSSDAGLSNSTGKRLTFAAGYVSPTWATILMAPPSLPSGPDVPGTYRLFLRIRRNSAANKRLVVKAYVRGGQLSPEPNTIPANATNGIAYLVDLGLVQWPSNQPAGLVAPFANASGAVPSGVLLQMWQLEDGVGTWDVDYVAFLPADEDGGEFFMEGSGLQTPASQHVVIDGYQNTATQTNADPAAGAYNILPQPYFSNIPGFTLLGGAPRLRPGDNRLFIVPGLHKSNTWPLARTWNVAVSYWPRYTWLR